MVSFEYVVFRDGDGQWAWRLYMMEGDQYCEEKKCTEVASGAGYEEEEAAENDAAFELVFRCS